MKTYDEIAKSLIERRDQYIVEKKKRNKKIVGVATSVSCLCLVAIISLLAIVGNNSSGVLPIIADIKNPQVDNAQVQPGVSDKQENASDASNDDSETKGPSGNNKKPGKKPGAQNADSKNPSVNATDEDVIINYENGKGPHVNSKDNHGIDKDITENQTVTNTEPKYIEKIVITRLPDKTTYYLGDKFDLRGLQVMGYFTNGEVEDVSERIYLLHRDIAGAVSNHYGISIEFTDDSECINIAGTSFEVVVLEPDINISENSVTLNNGDSYKLSASTKATGCTINWFSTDSSVVTVDNDGNVTAVGEGTASVYAEISYGSFKKNSNYCSVTVSEALSE